MAPRTADPDAAGDGAAAAAADSPWAALRQTPLDASLWLALARDYQRHELPWQAAYAARQALRSDPGARGQLETLALGDRQEPNAGDAQLGQPRLAHAAALIERFRARTRERPDDWLSWLYLARLHDMRAAEQAAAADPPTTPGAPEPTATIPPDPSPASARDAALAQARQHEILPGESLHWLGVWRLNAGDAAGAVDALSALIDIRPPRHGSLMYLGEALLRSDRSAAAETAFSRASQSANPDFLCDLAARVYAHNYWREAIALLQKALALRPDHVPTWLALARIQSEVHLLGDCRDSLERIARLAPGQPEAALLTAGLHGRLGDARSQRLAQQELLAANDDPLSRLASSIAMTALYDDSLTAGEIAALHRQLCAPIEAALPERSGFPNPRTTQRRLRIGYVTGDLHRQHPVNLFMLPVLGRHDHRRCDITVYHTGRMFDAYTRRAQAAVDRWRDASRLDDHALQRTIIGDGIDLLVDLAGHTASHRLGLFALRAAPVQATFLGYPHSTGLTRIDWLIGDPIVAPAAHAGLFSEGIAQLPDSVFCWAPVDDYPLPPPRPAGAPIVFASFNNALKLSPRTIALWSRVLHVVAGSRLCLKAPSLHDPLVQDRLRERFAAHGISADRLELRGPSGLADMMQEYGAVDIALDPTPYNGGTTTLQALWMGVPVVTLAGDNFVGRMGASFLASLGQHDRIASDAAAYVAIAARLASDPQLRAGRSALRAHLNASPLCALERWVGALEALYARMWVAYAEDRPLRLLAAAAAPPFSQPATPEQR